MRNAACSIAFSAVLAAALPAWAAPQGVQLERAPRPAQAAGYSIAAAAANLVYFPLRLTLTALTGELGGLTGWMTGGNRHSERAVCGLTEGQAFITPRVLEGRESLRFGPWPNESN
jgi:hypothetical protein